MNEKFTFRRCGACCQMKSGTALLSFALLALSTFAGPRLVVPQLPEAVRPLAEVETNVVFSTGAATDNKWTLTIERDVAVSNSVEVVSPTCFNPDWNLARVVSRGAETIRVESKISINALTLRVR